MRISDMKVNGKTVQEAKLNNKIVYRKETSVKNIIYNADFRFGTDVNVLFESFIAKLRVRFHRFILFLRKRTCLFQ